jgi:hypothetical protein
MTRYATDWIALKHSYSATGSINEAAIWSRTNVLRERPAGTVLCTIGLLEHSTHTVELVDATEEVAADPAGPGNPA